MSLIVFLLLIYFSYIVILQNDFLISRFIQAKEGNLSGRTELYSSLWMYYKNSDIKNLLFGYGFAQSIRFVGNTAHNDWLEILIGQGIMGISLYFFYFSQ
jgi:O-antigen ligase